MKNSKLLSLYAIIVIVLLFLAASYFAQENISFFEKYLKDSLIGMLVFSLLMIIETVLAPISILPIIAVASNIWGPIPTALLTILSWTIGSLIAFGLGRHFGMQIVSKFFSEEKIIKVESLIPERNIFLGIVLLRLAIPVDLLSYVLGIFTRMKWRTYTFATLIGITPLAFLLAYLGNIPILYQSIAALIGGIIILSIVIYSITRKKPRKKRLKKVWNKTFKEKK